MVNKINITKLLKDCPKGMELDSPLFDGLVLESVDDDDDDDSEYPIRVRTKEGVIWSVTSYGCWFNIQSAKCVIFPKGKATWEGFVPPCNFNDGDLLYVKTNKGFEFVFAYRKTYNEKYLCKYVSIVKQTGMLMVNLDAVCEINHIENIRFATDAEKEEFFSVCDKNGYKWDCENKKLEKNTDTEGQNSGQKFDIGTLKPFDKVLVRDGAGFWRPSLFGADMITGYRYLTSGGNYRECVPYEGNEHLVGTTKQCDDYYKTWTD